VFDPFRTDITGKLRGEIREREIILTLHGREIGRIPFDASCVRVDDGFEVDDERVYRLEDVNRVHPEQYVDCDSAGWC
jgi:hypothetical protein